MTNNFGKIVAIVAVVVIIAAGLFFFLGEREPEDPLDRVLRRVGDEEITQRDLNELIFGIDFQGSVEDPRDVDEDLKNELLDQLVEWKVVEQRAKEKGVSVSEEDFERKGVERLGEERFAQLEEMPEDQRNSTEKVIRNAALVDKMKEEAISWAEGSVIIVRFDHYLGYERIPEEQRAIDLDEAQEREGEIREYAEELAEEIHQDIAEEEMTPEEAIDMVYNDPIVGEEGFAPQRPRFGFSFTKEEFLQEDGKFALNPYLRETVLDSEVGLNEPEMMQVHGYGDDDSEDGYLAIVYLEERHDGESDSYYEWLSENKEDLLSNTASRSFLTPEPEPVYAQSLCSVRHSRWGVNTGNANSLAGLIIRTRQRTANGNFVRMSDIDVEVTSIGRPNDGVMRTDGVGRVDRTTGSRTFTTGARWWAGPAPAGDNTSCTARGYAVLGYGYHTNAHYSYGNLWGLSCSGSPFDIEVQNDPDGYGSWENDSERINVVNGETEMVTFTWEEYAAVDCEWEWGDWGDCEDGEQSREVIVTQEPRYGGQSCPDETVQTRDCYTLDVDIEGDGQVTNDGIDCPGDCSNDYPPDTEVSLDADADSGWYFRHWDGDCSGSDCSVTMNRGREVTAVFEREPSVSELDYEYGENEYCNQTTPPGSLSWEAETYGADYSRYELEVLRNDNVVDEASNGAVSSIDLGTLSDVDFDTTYQWRVRIQNNDGEWSDWAESSFETQPLHPDPSFTWSPEEPFAEEETEFSSQGNEEYIDTWSWSFTDDAEPSTSSDQDPVVVFEEEGEKEVTLEVGRNGMNCSETRVLNMRPPLPEWEEGDPF